MRFGRVIGVGLLLAVGCGYPSAKLEEARGHVQKALETWQAGGKPDALKGQTPPVNFSEAMWTAGDKLVRFDLGPATYVERDDVVRCEVRLVIRDRKGKERTEPAFYDVTLGPPVKVVNNPMP